MKPNASRIVAFSGPTDSPSPEWISRALAAATRGSAAELASLPRTHLHRAGVSVGGVARGAPKQVGDLIIAMDGLLYQENGSIAAVADLYQAHGMAGTLARLEGDFALVLFDGRTGILHVARDRFGVKPVYYARVGQGLAVASRLMPLLVAPGVDRSPDPRFVALFAGSHYRTFDNATDRTPYAGISQLPAGCRLEIRGPEARVFSWYKLVEQPDVEGSEEELAEKYRDLLMDAVRRRRASTGDDAFTLSGGMDSSSVVACAVKDGGRKIHAYSSTYLDPTYDESEEISSMLAETVEQWHQVSIGSPDLAVVVSKMIDANDEPVATATWLSHYVLCEQVASDGFRTLYGGLGGDELNAGEYEYFFFFFADLARTGRRDVLDHEVQQWVAHHDHPIFRKSRAVADDALQRLVDMSSPGVCLPDLRRVQRYGSAVKRDWFDVASYRPIMDAPFTSYLKNRTYQDIFRETAPCCLRAADRQAAAFGMDVVWPFFDTALVEYMFRIPGTLKIRSGVTKHLLRRAMEGILPEATRTRVKKTGWNAPAHVWFTGRGASMLRDVFASREFREMGIYDNAVVEQLLAEHENIVSSGRAQDNHMMFFWQLINLHLWFTWLRSI